MRKLFIIPAVLLVSVGIITTILSGGNKTMRNLHSTAAYCKQPLPYGIQRDRPKKRSAMSGEIFAISDGTKLVIAVVLEYCS